MITLTLSSIITWIIVGVDLALISALVGFFRGHAQGYEQGRKAGYARAELDRAVEEYTPRVAALEAAAAELERSLDHDRR